MGRKIKVLDRDNFVDAINDYCKNLLKEMERSSIKNT